MKQDHTPTMDYLNIALIVNIISLLVAVISALVLAYGNLNSKSIVLASSALTGAAIIFGLQLFFELRKTTEQYRITSEIMIDRVSPEIRVLNPNPKNQLRLGLESQITAWLKSQDKRNFDKDREKTTIDFVLFQLFSIFQSESDWQTEKEVFIKSTGRTIITKPLSTIQEFKAYSVLEIKKILSDSGNLFSQAPFAVSTFDLKFPPNSKIVLTKDSLTVRNLYCEVVFKVSLSGSINFMDPRDQSRRVDFAPGESRFETRPIAVKVTVTYFGIRAYHSDMVKYKKWVAQMTSDLQDWF